MSVFSDIEYWQELAVQRQKEAIKFREQRDELVAALHEVLCTHDYHADDGQIAADKAREALAKVKELK
jgi:hypothetical protein